MSINFESVYNDTLNNGGCTVDLNGITPDRGYLVGMKGTELKVPLSEFSPKVIRKYVKSEFIFPSLKGNRYLVTWVNAGYVYLDVSMLIINRARAIERGLSHGQLAIYDLDNQETIEIQQNH